MSESFGIPSSLSSLTSRSLTATSSTAPSTGESQSIASAPASSVSQPPQPPAASARSLAQRLDSLFLKVAQATTCAVSKNDLASTVSKTSLPSDKISALKQAVDEAEASYKELSQLTGRELAEAIKVDDKGRFDWQFSWDAIGIKLKLDKQANLASLLHQAASDPSVKGEEFENLSEMAAQADRRQMEILTLALQLADAIQQKTDDPEVVKQLDAKLETLLPRQALKMNGNEAAIEKMKAQLQPLVDRIDALASRPNASISSEELVVLQHETAMARNALEHAAKEGFPTPDGGRWLPDKAFFTEAKKLIAEMEERFSDTRQTIGLAYMKAFVKDAFAIPDECTVVNETNLPFLEDVAPNLVRAVKIRHKMHEKAMVYINKSFEKDPDSETTREIREALSSLTDLAGEYKTISAQAIQTEIENLMDLNAMKREGWEKLQAIFKAPHGIMSQVTHLKSCIDLIHNELSPEQFLSTDSARAVLDGKLALTTIVEARIHGIKDADVNPKLDDSNLVSAEPLDHDTAILRYKDGSEFVFQPEATGYQGVDSLALSKDYEAEQQVAQRNLATQKTAEALGLEDVILKSTVGCHDSRYGLFMEKAHGLAAYQFAKGKAPKDGGLSLEQIMTLPDEQYIKILGEVIRQTNRLEWLDLITGLGDRHWWNYMIDVRSNGTVTVKGIDNFECFPDYRTGLCTFHLSGRHAREFRELREKIITSYSESPEARARLEGDPGVVDNKVVNPLDDSIDIDATKFEADELPRILREIVGFYGTDLPKFIDEDLYEHLQTLKKGNPARDAYLDELGKRLPDKAVASAATRLDQAIAHAELLKKNGMVFSQEDFWKKSKLEGILKQEFPKSGEILEKSKDGKSPISSKSVMALAFFPQAQHSLFGRDLAILCKKDWLSSVRNS